MPICVHLGLTESKLLVHLSSYNIYVYCINSHVEKYIIVKYVVFFIYFRFLFTY